MSTTDLPVIILLLLPGFIALQLFTWTSHKRRLSNLETILWLLILSFTLLVPVSLAWHWLDSKEPTPGAILEDPTSVRLRVAASMYLVALPLGWIAGKLDRARIFEKFMSPLGIDMRRRHDVWYLAFRDSYFVIVYLQSGQQLYGWPAMSTTNRDGSAAEILLEKPHVWSKTKQEWLEKPELTGIWIDSSKIERIDFTARPEVAEKVVENVAASAE